MAALPRAPRAPPEPAGSGEAAVQEDALDALAGDALAAQTEGEQLLLQRVRGLQHEHERAVAKLLKEQHRGVEEALAQAFATGACVGLAAKACACDAEGAAPQETLVEAKVQLSNVDPSTPAFLVHEVTSDVQKPRPLGGLSRSWTDSSLRLQAHVEGNEVEEEKEEHALELVELESVASGRKHRVSIEERNIIEQIARIRGKEYVPTNAFSRVLQTRACDYMVSLLLIGNALAIGISADWKMRRLHPPDPAIFSVLDTIFTVCFSAELGLRILAERSYFYAFKNTHLGWNMFDFFLVLSALVEEVMLVFSTRALNMSTLRLLRILRLVRIARIIRVMRFFRELRVMLNCICDSSRTLVWSCVLLTMIVYILSTVVLQISADLLSDADADEYSEIYEHFGSLPISMVTLYMAVSGGIDWGDASGALGKLHPLLEYFFLLYIGFATFCVLNIVTSVFVDKGMKLSQEDDSEMTVTHLESQLKLLQDLRRLFSSCDEDGDGQLGWQEFEKLFLDVRLQAHLRRLGMKTDRESALGYFILFDFEGIGRISLETFVRGIEHFNGSAKSIDVYRLLQEQRSLREAVDSINNLLAKQVRSGVFSNRSTANM
eukprot:TRINITY_DN59686_c0_g1_i1.p1 TRINITY_DN59686_c0_g1~~TRINITY_DN59686_c0_g1_i1.p1  ORF type:complete len:629 (+),score=129.69 TRINITY_DN59686_c0_g1_i1:75-1889(+)